MADEKDIVKGVVEVLYDGHQGFADLAEQIEDPEVKAFFVKESQTRAEFASDLESAAMLKKDEAGTAAGAFNRFWAEFKGKLGGGDPILLETAEQGEDAANETYKKALKEDVITASVRQILVTQQSHVQQAHDQVKAFRDRKVA